MITYRVDRLLHNGTWAVEKRFDERREDAVDFYAEQRRKAPTRGYRVVKEEIIMGWEP